MRRAVVQHEMDVQIRLDLLVDQALERQELLVPVSRLALGDHLADCNVECREWCGRAFP